MVRVSRYVFALFAWLFVAGVVAQVFFAGVGIFQDRGAFRTHADLGWILHLAPILVLIAAALGRAGRSALLWTAALVVVTFIQPILATMRTDSPELAALHPVAALLVFWLALTVALRALQIARSTGDAAGSQTATGAA